MRKIEEVFRENKEANNGYVSCDLSNFRILCNRIQQHLNDNDLEKATDEMCSFSLLASGLLDRKSKWNTTNFQRCNKH